MSHSSKESLRQAAIDLLRERLPREINVAQPSSEEYQRKFQEFLDSSYGLSPDVRFFVIYVLLGAIAPPRSRGQPPKLLRDMEIAAAVDRELRRDPSLTVSRNDASGEHSACDLVSHYLGELGIDLDHKSVAEIYRKHRVLKK